MSDPGSILPPAIFSACCICVAVRIPVLSRHGLVTYVASSIARLDYRQISLRNLIAWIDSHCHLSLRLISAFQGLAAWTDSHWHLSLHLVNALEYLHHLPSHIWAHIRANPIATMRLALKTRKPVFKIIRQVGNLFTCWRYLSYLDIGTALVSLLLLLVFSDLIPISCSASSFPFSHGLPSDSLG